MEEFRAYVRYANIVTRKESREALQNIVDDPIVSTHWGVRLRGQLDCRPAVCQQNEICLQPFYLRLLVNFSYRKVSRQPGRVSCWPRSTTCPGCCWPPSDTCSCTTNTCSPCCTPRPRSTTGRALNRYPHSEI